MRSNQQRWVAISERNNGSWSLCLTISNNHQPETTKCNNLRTWKFSGTFRTEYQHQKLNNCIKRQFYCSKCTFQQQNFWRTSQNYERYNFKRRSYSKIFIEFCTATIHSTACKRRGKQYLPGRKFKDEFQKILKLYTLNFSIAPNNNTTNNTLCVGSPIRLK